VTTRTFRLIFLLFLVAALAAAVVGCSSPDGGKDKPVADVAPAPKLQVVTTTTLIEDIVKSVGGERVQVTNIIPPGSCPGHFDVKPGDLKCLAEAKLFLMHGWQGKKFSEELIKSAANPGLQKVVLDLEGNWMAPPVQVQAIDAVTDALAAADPDNAASYREAAAARKKRVEETGRELKARLEQARAGEVKVLCADMQAGFVKWMGFPVVAVYGRPEDTTPKQLEELLNRARSEGVKLVIDNLQSGHEAGVGIAKELGAKHVTLSNFPGGLPNTASWEEAIRHNVALVLKAVEG